MALGYKATKTIKDNKMQQKSVFHVTPAKNLAYISEMGLIPQVGERSEQLEENPKVFLFVSRLAMEDALMNWFGDQFEEHEPLVAIEVNSEHLELSIDPAVAYEVTVDRVISPALFRKFIHL